VLLHRGRRHHLAHPRPRQLVRTHARQLNLFPPSACERRSRMCAYVVCVCVCVVRVTSGGCLCACSR
jgi:hypothetical protein